MNTKIQTVLIELKDFSIDLSIPLEDYDVHEINIDTETYYFVKRKGSLGIDIHVALYDINGKLITDTWWAPDCGDSILWKSIEEQVEWLLKSRA